MKSNGLIFILAFVLAFAGGYFFFTNDKTNDTQIKESSESPTEAGKESKDEKEQTSVPAEYEILNTKSCLSCHAVSSLGLEGGNTGPDLSNAYSDIEGKHGIDLNSFLQKPTSAVMSSVIEGSPLSADEREEILEVLKKASEK
ncbi:cytochrome C [Sporosarcina sp. FA9]|uniref:cytochrome C n=1 Tax=Sporosarcina sp. FA9 TaxID=3413030 RepID=UPI003F65852C